jgi:plasmid stabilization system protein ParE
VFKVIVSPRARHDLLEIIDYIRQDNPAAADRFGNELLNHTELLADFPHIGALIRQRSGVRKLLHTPIRIYYRIDEQRSVVEILHFWHAARQEPDL